MSAPDHKNKSISSLVRVLTFLIILVSMLYSCGSGINNSIDDNLQPPGCGNASDTQNYVYKGIDGEKMYKSNCSSCHAVEKSGVSPALKGATDRMPGGNYRYLFVRNEDSLFEAGDLYAVHLRDSFQMNCLEFPHLTNDEIDAIFHYATRYTMTRY